MINFDKLIKNVKQELEVLNSESSKSSHKIGALFLKGGIHKIRIIPVNDTLIVTEYVHSYKIDGKTKNVVCPGKECPICKVAEEVEDWKIKVRKLNKSLIYLIDTSSPDEYWIPGGYYILVSNGDRFKKTLLTYITSNLNAGENGKVLVGNLLDYTKEMQGSLQVMVHKKQRFISVSFDSLTKSPKLDEEIVKDFDLMKAFIDFTVKPDPKELEEDAMKLRLKYKNKEKTFTEQTEITTQSTQAISLATQEPIQEPIQKSTQKQQQQTTREYSFFKQNPILEVEKNIENIENRRHIKKLVHNPLRKNLFKRKETITSLDLLYIIKKSFEEFVQFNKNLYEREDKDLEHIFRTSFPLVDLNGQTETRYIIYEREVLVYKEKFIIEDYKYKELTYLIPLKVLLEFVVNIDTDFKNEYWIPENYYILVPNEDKFKKTLLLIYVISILNKGENGKVLLDNLLDYIKETQRSSQIMVQSRNQGFTSVSLDPLTKSSRLDEEIVKDFDLIKAFIDFIVKSDSKKLEKDVMKLKLKYNNKRKTSAGQTKIIIQPTQVFQTH